MSPPIFRVISYARVSLEERSGRDYTSLDAQEDFIARHCAHQSEILGAPWRVVASFRDEQSGKNLQRPGLKALLDHLDHQGADAVAVYKLDRISRSLLDFLTLDARLQAGNVATVSIRENFDTSTPIGRAMRSLLLVFAQLERETTLQRTNDAFDTRVREGRWAGAGVRYGFRRVERGKLAVDPEQAAIAERMFRMFAIEGTSTLDIAAVFNQEGIPSPRGGQWSSVIVRSILRTDAFHGLQRHGDRVGPWPFDQVIDPQLAAIAAERLAQISRKAGPNRIRHPWQGLIKCGYCGSAVGLHTSHGGPRARDKRYDYLECTQPVRAKELGQAKCTLRAPYRWQADWTEAVLEACRRAQPAPKPEPRPDVARELARIAGERRRYTVAFTAPGSLLAEGEYLAALAELDRQEQALRPPDPPDHAAAISLADSWVDLEIGERNSALRALVHRAVMYADRVEIELKRTGWESWPERLPPIRREL